MLCHLSLLANKQDKTRGITLYGYAWIMQDSGNKSAFVSEFKQRIIDTDYQQWQMNINNKPKLTSYSTYKSLLNVEYYLSYENLRIYKQALARFRCGCHISMIELGRPTGFVEECRLCTYCSRYGLDCVEKQFHFLPVCSAFTDLRNQYIHHNYPSLTSYVNLIPKVIIRSRILLNIYSLPSNYIRHFTSDVCTTLHLYIYDNLVLC